MKKTKIYISGKMSGLSRKRYTMLFSLAQQSLEQRGYEVINPAAHQQASANVAYKDALATDMALLASCDAIYMLCNWQDSPGAKAEYAFATACGMPVLYQLTIEDARFMAEAERLATLHGPHTSAVIIATDGHHDIAVTGGNRNDLLTAVQKAMKNTNARDILTTAVFSYLKENGALKFIKAPTIPHDAVTSQPLPETTHEEPPAYRRTNDQNITSTQQ